MEFEYMICDTAHEDVYKEAADFIIDMLGYRHMNDELQDVDGSIWRTFEKGSQRLVLKSDVQINYVVIISDTELPIRCLRKWKKA